MKPVEPAVNAMFEVQVNPVRDAVAMFITGKKLPRPLGKANTVYVASSIAIGNVTVPDAAEVLFKPHCSIRSPGSFW